MKKIALLIILFYSLQLTSQTSDLIPVLLKEAEKVCETGDYKKLVKYSEEYTKTQAAVDPEVRNVLHHQR